MFLGEFICIFAYFAIVLNEWRTSKKPNASAHSNADKSLNDENPSTLPSAYAEYHETKPEKPYVCTLNFVSS